MLKDRTGVAPAARPGRTAPERGVGVVRAFMDHHYRNFNARETVAAARAYEAHSDAGGKMLMTLAGAMSTGQLGVILARMIREGRSNEEIVQFFVARYGDFVSYRPPVNERTAILWVGPVALLILGGLGILLLARRASRRVEEDDAE